MDPRYSFLDQELPPGYVGGMGRGATGFTTQLDIGGLRNNISGLQQEEPDDDDEEVEKYDDVDEEGLLISKDKDDEDDEADKIYEEIENRMKLRRKRRIDEVDQEARDTNLISEQFQDLKQALTSVTETEWLNLPEVGDLTKKNKRQREALQMQQRYYAVPDSVLNGMKNSETNNSTIEDVTDFKSISSAKDKLLGLQLDTGAVATTVDSIEYVKSLDSIQAANISNVANVKKARLVLSSLRKTEPNNISAWISSARLEESVKRFKSARELIEEGCEINPTSAEIWLENVRLNKKEGKSIIRQLLSFQPNAVSLWLVLCQLENDIFSKKRLLRKLLENIPTSVELWDAALTLEGNEEDKKKMLLKLVELTNSIELWIKLIDLEKDLSQAKKFLNEARKQNPESIDIWIHAAKLEEKTSENEIKISKLLQKGIKTIPMSRDEYMKKAIELELAGFPITCSVILQNVIDLDAEGLSDTSKIKLWLNDAKIATEKGFIESAKSIYQFVVMRFPNNIKSWQQFLQFIKQYKPLELFIFFQEAIDANGKVEFFWLWFAKEYLNLKDFDNSRRILSQAMEVLPNNEDILFALIKLETLKASSVGNIKELYQKGIDDIGTVRVYYRYVTFLRTRKEIENALEVLDLAIGKFPECYKLYLQSSQVYISQGDSAKAREILNQGTITVPNSIPIWISLSRVEKSTLKKNAILDKLILANPNSGLLWREKFRLEKEYGDIKISRSILSKLLKMIPDSPELWCDNLLNLERKALQKTSFRDAMLKTNDHPLVLNTIGLILWKEGKISRCKNFFDKSIEINSDIGDSWVIMYLFLTKHGDSEEIDQLLRDMEESDPHHGEIWCQVSKDIEMIDKSKREILDLAVKLIVI